MLMSTIYKYYEITTNLLLLGSDFFRVDVVVRVEISAASPVILDRHGRAVSDVSRHFRFVQRVA